MGCSRCAPRVPLAPTASGSKPHDEARRSRRRCLSRPPASQPAPRPASSALPSTWQNAAAFNQLLTFDTSSVTTMDSMFYVRSARAPRSPLPSVLNPTLKRAARAAAASHALPPPDPHLAPHRLPSLQRGRTQTPCPMPTSCSSVARGSAPLPSPLLAMDAAGWDAAGVQETANEDRLRVVLATTSGGNKRLRINIGTLLVLAKRQRA